MHIIHNFWWPWNCILLQSWCNFCDFCKWVNIQASSASVIAFMFNYHWSQQHYTGYIWLICTWHHGHYVSSALTMKAKQNSTTYVIKLWHDILHGGQSQHFQSWDTGQNWLWGWILAKMSYLCGNKVWNFYFVNLFEFLSYLL